MDSFSTFFNERVAESKLTARTARLRQSLMYNTFIVSTNFQVRCYLTIVLYLSGADMGGHLGCLSFYLLVCFLQVCLADEHTGKIPIKMGVYYNYYCPIIVVFLYLAQCVSSPQFIFYLTASRVHYNTECVK